MPTAIPLLPRPSLTANTSGSSMPAGKWAAGISTGKEVWRRQYKPWGEPYPFNKQHEPILYGDTILNVEPRDPGRIRSRAGTICAESTSIPARHTWIAEDGTTTYATSVFGHMKDGTPAVLTARGGWHDVPERPVGLGLVDLRPGKAGKTLWRFVADTDADGKPLAEPGSLAAPTWQALYVLHWDEKYAYWFRLNPEESHLVIDSQTGKLLREQSLIRQRGLPAVGSGRGQIHRTPRCKPARDPRAFAAQSAQAG